MAKEIERKFLVDHQKISTLLENAPKSHLAQYYVKASKELAIRLRLENKSHVVLAVKSGTDPMRMEEYEYPLAFDAYEENKQDMQGIEIEKVRHFIAYDGRTWEVDVFDGALSGLIVAEIECEDAADIKHFPEWVTKEVTYDTRFKNAQLALNGLSDINPSATRKFKSIPSEKLIRFSAEKLIRLERARQMEEENFSFAHDAEHTDGELLKAALVYLHVGTDKALPTNERGIPLDWPWEDEWFKPKDRVKNLVRAGALCLAEDQRINALMKDGRPKMFEAPWDAGTRAVYDDVVRELDLALKAAA
jgi:adenylate cyclase